jgi:hypothetical protein
VNGWDYLGQDWQGFKDWWSEGTEANVDWVVEGTQANAEKVEEVFEDVVETVSDASTFIGVEINAGLGIGYTYVSCCDEKGAKRKFHYMKYCVGPAVGVALSVGGVTGLDGEDCRSGNYAGIFLEININAHPFVGGAVDLGFGHDLLSGVNDIGLSFGLGAGVTVCNYVLIDEEIEHCACGGESGSEN